MSGRKISWVLVVALAVSSAFLGIKVEAKKGEHLTGTVNINTASQEELVMIPGIGPAKAAAIVEYRKTAKFNSTEDIIKVKGIGEKLYQSISPYITVDGPTTAKVVKDVSVDLDSPTAGEKG